MAGAQGVLGIGNGREHSGSLGLIEQDNVDLARPLGPVVRLVVICQTKKDHNRDKTMTG